jgi:hypothetical protein
MVIEDAATVDMEKTSGRAVVVQVCYTQTVLEDRAMSFRTHLDSKVERKATVVELENQVAKG